MPAFLALAVTLSSCVFAPTLYWAEMIHGQVIDADSGQPIEGAVVVADWKLYGGGIGHGGHHRSLFVEETVPNSDRRMRSSTRRRGC
jgi:hypothetical protein